MAMTSSRKPCGARTGSVAAGEFVRCCGSGLALGLASRRHLVVEPVRRGRCAGVVPESAGTAGSGATGDYVIDIRDASAGGKLTVVYLNPRPINVAKPRRRLWGTLKVFVELRDVTTPALSTS